jgi:beta-exotoxin I transport system permease protein
VTGAAFRLELRLRARSFALAGLGLMAVAAITGALFPSFGESLGKVDLPEGVGDLLGGGDFASISGWLNTEIASVYGPLVVAGSAIAAAAATIAGEEERRILALVLAHPVARTRLLLAKGAAIALLVAGLGVACWLGLLLSVALAGGGIGAGKLAALALHLAFLGLAFGALALALGGVTGRRAVAAGGSAAVAVAMYLVNGLAPVVADWLQYLTLFHYYEGGEPLRNGVDAGHLVVLAAVTAVLLAVAAAGFRDRDLRG